MHLEIVVLAGEGMPSLVRALFIIVEYVGMIDVDVACTEEYAAG